MSKYNFTLPLCLLLTVAVSQIFAQASTTKGKEVNPEKPMKVIRVTRDPKTGKFNPSDIAKQIPVNSDAPPGVREAILKTISNYTQEEFVAQSKDIDGIINQVLNNMDWSQYGVQGLNNRTAKLALALAKIHQKTPAALTNAGVMPTKMKLPSPKTKLGKVLNVKNDIQKELEAALKAAQEQPAIEAKKPEPVPAPEKPKPKPAPKSLPDLGLGGLDGLNIGGLDLSALIPELVASGDLKLDEFEKLKGIDFSKVDLGKLLDTQATVMEASEVVEEVQADFNLDSVQKILSVSQDMEDLTGNFEGIDVDLLLHQRTCLSYNNYQLSDAMADEELCIERFPYMCSNPEWATTCSATIHQEKLEKLERLKGAHDHIGKITKMFQELSPALIAMSNSRAGRKLMSEAADEL